MIHAKIEEIMSADSKEFESHEDLKKTIERVRSHALFSSLSEGLDPEAEQHFLLALSLLEQAMCHAMLVEYSVRRERVRTKR
jgi:hypothetical protein